MTLVIPDDYAQVIFNISHASDPNPWAITFGVFKGSESDPQELVEEVGNVCRTNFRPNGDTAYRYGPTTLRLNQLGVESVYIDPEQEIGTGGSADFLPQNSAILVHKRTARGGRRGRGRFYIPGVQEDHVSDTGLLDEEYLSDLQDNMNALLTGMTSEPLPTVGMWLLHGTGLSAVVDPDEVTLLTVDPVIATQRRRLRR